MSSFVLAEMSDKTSLATLTLASDHDWVGVWLGSTLGMVLADGLAIPIGTWLHQRLPTQLLHVLASLLFLVFRIVDPVRLRFGPALGGHRRCCSGGAGGGNRLRDLQVANFAPTPNAGPERRTVTGRRLSCRRRPPHRASAPHGCVHGPLHAYRAGFGRGRVIPHSKGNARQICVDLPVARDQAFPLDSACLTLPLITTELKRRRP